MKNNLAAAMLLLSSQASYSLGAVAAEPRFHETEIEILNEDAGIKLVGTLTLPASSESAPAVLLIPGVSAFDRNQTIFGHEPFRVLAEHLARNGIAALRMDDRGVGGSSGEKAQAGMGDLAADTLLGLQYLQRHEKTDPARVGLLGHSGGTIVASMAAARSSKVAFLVLLAGTAHPYAELVVQPWREDGESIFSPVKEHMDVLVSILREGPPGEDAERRIRERWAAIRETLTSDQRETVKPFTDNWDSQLSLFLKPLFRDLLILDPARRLAEVGCPVLALVGQKDNGAALAKHNFPRMLKALESGSADYALMKLANLNHLLQRCVDCTMAEAAEIDEAMSAAALGAITDWIRSHTIPRAGP